ncbi:uncharacterized protein LOC108049816 [Drosophila rhopaloa]|uniref:Uncharacterized protein LOC108049816 n=1 Tax=Drosophila rhopaloa TaxID=1041015 RepID=A0A6P4FH11_DRORH|nr:uncharacterized protein LOC108049816 [Drosophila rhopaloa]
MDVKQQLERQDVNQDGGEVATGSKDLELVEHGDDLSRNSSLTTVCSTFPLTARIDSYHCWQPMDSKIGEKDTMDRELDSEKERKMQLAMSMPLTFEVTQP